MDKFLVTLITKFSSPVYRNTDKNFFKNSQHILICAKGQKLESLDFLRKHYIIIIIYRNENGIEASPIVSYVYTHYMNVSY